LAIEITANSAFLIMENKKLMGEDNIFGVI